MTKTNKSLSNKDNRRFVLFVHVQHVAARGGKDTHIQY